MRGVERDVAARDLGARLFGAQVLSREYSRISFGDMECGKASSYKNRAVFLLAELSTFELPVRYQKSSAPRDLRAMPPVTTTIYLGRTALVEQFAEVAPRAEQAQPLQDR